MYQERDAVTESGRDRFDLLHRARGIEEEHVGARVHIGFAAPQGGLESFDRDGVGAGDDDEIRILPRFAASPDLCTISSTMVAGKSGLPFRHDEAWIGRLSLQDRKYILDCLHGNAGHRLAGRTADMRSHDDVR